MSDGNVLYTYDCSECGHKGGKHLQGDGHEGESAKCAACGSEVVLEWDEGAVMVGDNNQPIGEQKDW